MRTLIKAILPLCLLLTLAGAAAAQTPDGTPPSGETVCDGEFGAAYGLCNAYCEAMDCESDDPQASETACNKVRSKFQNITGRDVPCEVPAVTCPCTSIPAFNADLAGMTVCVEFAPGVLSFEGDDGVRSIVDTVDSPGQCSTFIAPIVVRLPMTPEEGAFCLQLVLDAAASNGVTCD